VTGWALVAIIDVLIVGAGVVVFTISAMFGVVAYRAMQAVSVGASVTDEPLGHQPHPGDDHGDAGDRGAEARDRGA